MPDARPADQVQGEDWASTMGDKWLANIDAFESMIAAPGAAHGPYRRPERARRCLPRSDPAGSAPLVRNC